MVSQEVIEAWSSTAAIAEQVIKVSQSILKQAEQSVHSEKVKQHTSELFLKTLLVAHSYIFDLKGEILGILLSDNAQKKILRQVRFDPCEVRLN